MRIPFAICFFAFGGALACCHAQTGALAANAAGQAAAPAQPAQVERDDVGFSYSLPSGWEVVAPAAAPKVDVPFPTAAPSRKGDACVDVALTAKRGASASAVVVMALPFACYGKTITASDLANLGSGVAQGMRQTFKIGDATVANYRLGSHAVWVERATGTAKHHPGSPFTFEIACTVLAKGAACWLTMASDTASLQGFEQGVVSLDGEAPAALVPGGAFAAKKPM